MRQRHVENLKRVGQAFQTTCIFYSHRHGGDTSNSNKYTCTVARNHTTRRHVHAHTSPKLESPVDSRASPLIFDDDDDDVECRHDVSQHRVGSWIGLFGGPHGIFALSHPVSDAGCAFNLVKLRPGLFNAPRGEVAAFFYREPSSDQLRRPGGSHTSVCLYVFCTPIWLQRTEQSGGIQVQWREVRRAYSEPGHFKWSGCDPEVLNYSILQPVATGSMAESGQSTAPGVQGGYPCQVRLVCSPNHAFG